MGLFGKEPQKTPREQVREWNSKLRKQSMMLDRQLRAIQREEDKVKASLKQAAKKGDRQVCTILAKEIVNSRKAAGRIHVSKAQINSVMMHMNSQLATLRVAGAMEKSADVLKCMQKLMKVTEVAQVMEEMSKEMMKAGIIEEMLDDTLDEVTEAEDAEEEIQAEVEKVLNELTQGQLVKAPTVVTDTLPQVAEAKPATSRHEEEDEEEISEMQKRLEALRS